MSEARGCNRFCRRLPEYYAGNGIKWNFTKFLIDRQGDVDVVKRFESPVVPADMESAIEALL
jgi:glutathione peroxidase